MSCLKIYRFICKWNIFLFQQISLQSKKV